ncbi:eee6e510-6cc1-4566-999d-212bf57055f1 [Sclerotinia trifoliorum]|uniref:Eee6e510-6cc1-4566-999d-212bf57055f1 n=1 Tax=Sclerotinia trifoliorum TaxID=28548 RepID=A0A8H2VVG3_9HELO|nr:eee6e510-6cc1-4566-999d-212bf57055f1 [Sclerotinia trifoliorum]
MVGARRTRAAGASPGGFKSLDDIPKKSTRGRGKKIKAEPVEPSIESESSDPFITPAEANNNTESQKTQSSPANASRANSPDSQSPSPTPDDSRSTSPPPKTNIAFNDASSDNDVINHEQAAPPIAPLESKKRSRKDEPSTHESGGIANTEEDVEQRAGKRTRIAPLESKKRSREDEPSTHESGEIANTEEDVEERASKRTRRQQSSGVEDVAAEAEKSTEPELEPKRKSRGRPSNRTKATPKKPANKTRGRKQDPIVLNDSSSDEAAETTISPRQSRSTFTPKQPAVPFSHTPQHQQEISSSEDEPTGPTPWGANHDLNVFDALRQLNFLAPHLSKSNKIRLLFGRPLEGEGQYIVKEVAQGANGIPLPGKGKEVVKEVTPGASGTPLPGKGKGKEVVKEVAPGANDVAHLSERKTTAVASSSGNLSQTDAAYSAPQPPFAMRLTDPYLVAVAKVFTNHKKNSKALPSIEQVTAFLTAFDAQQPLYNPKAQMVTQKPTRPPQAKKPKRSGFCVPDTDSDDTDMSDGEEAQVVDEPKTPEAQIPPSQDASPQGTWWNTISNFTTRITSPFRKQSTAASDPLSSDKIAPPFIFNQPPTTPAAVPLKHMSHSDRKRNNGNNVQGRLAGFQTELHPRHRHVEETPAHIPSVFNWAEIKEMHKAQDEYAARRRELYPPTEVNQDIHRNARASQRAAVTTPVEAETSATTHAKAGEKRDADGAPKPRTSQRWNDFLRDETRFGPGFDPRWIRCRNGLFIRENCTDRQFETNYIVTDDDPCWADHYRDIDAFPKQDIFKPAGVQNPLNSAQLLEQANLRARGVAGIPDESENDYTYITDELQKSMIFYLGSPYNRFEIPGKRLTWDHMENIKEGIPLLNPRDEFGIAIKTPGFDPRRPTREQKTTNVFQQLHDWDKKHYYKDAVEMKAGRILEPKQWSQTPPPKPKPGNAKLPGAVEQTPAPISEAVKHAMSRANKYLPAKGSGLRQVSNMSPLQAEQERVIQAEQDRVVEAAKESKPMFNFDFSDESLGFHVDPLVKECVLERLGEGFVPITPMPDHIWHEHYDLQRGEVETAVAKLFEGIDPRLFGSMHNGIKVPEQPDMAIEFTSESPTNRPALKLW